MTKCGGASKSSGISGVMRVCLTSPASSKNLVNSRAAEAAAASPSATKRAMRMFLIYSHK